MRKLPDSFFNPPSTGSKSINHSRENSVDSAFAGGATAAAPVNSVPLQTAHHRAHRSPASLQQTYTVTKNLNIEEYIKKILNFEKVIYKPTFTKTEFDSFFQ